jgi:uracil-DNA glycosylase
MSRGSPKPGSAACSAEELRSLFEKKARAELAEADRLVPGADAVLWRGSLLPQLALVKGLPGPAEASGQPALSGADGEAVDKALIALGHDPATAFRMLSRPLPDADFATCAERLRLQIEAVDPLLVIALDAIAGEDLSRAFGLSRLRFGDRVTVSGRDLVAIDGLEASLVEPSSKRRVWNQLRAASPAGPVY